MFSKRVIILLSLLLFILLTTYSLFTLRDLRSDPKIELLEGQQYIQTSSSSISYVFGFDNTSGVFFNEEALMLSQDMRTDLTVYPLDGLNYYQIEAVNEFDRKKSILFTVVKEGRK